MSEKIRIGNGTKKSDKWLKSSICLTDIPKENTFEYNGKTYVKVDINIFDKPNKFGKDVSISIDEYKPEEKQYSAHAERKTASDTIARKVQESALNSSNEEFELPF
jgi:hypothetical protein